MSHGLFYWCIYYVSGPENISVVFLSMECQIALRFHQKHLNLCFEDEWRSYGFGTTWGWVMYRIFILGWTYPLTPSTIQSIPDGQNQVPFYTFLFDKTFHSDISHNREENTVAISISSRYKIFHSQVIFTLTLFFTLIFMISIFCLQ